MNDQEHEATDGYHWGDPVDGIVLGIRVQRAEGRPPQIVLGVDNQNAFAALLPGVFELVVVREGEDGPQEMIQGEGPRSTPGVESPPRSITEVLAWSDPASGCTGGGPVRCRVRYSDDQAGLSSGEVTVS